MITICLAGAAGALFSVAQFLLAKKMLDLSTKSAKTALYIVQLLILSATLLILMFLISETALISTASALVATSIVLAVINSLKR